MLLGCFDQVFVINLDKDTDRLRRVSDRLMALDVAFERFAGVPPPDKVVEFGDRRINAAIHGCSASHASLLELVFQRGLDTALILEDDVVFRDDLREWMEPISRQLRDLDWGIFYCGLNLIEGGRRVSANLGTVRLGYHTHAYAVRRSAIPQVLEYIRSSWLNPLDTFDSYSINNLLKVYAIPILAVQEPNFSHTFERVMDRLPQYFMTFDGDDFEEHCAEMRAWKSDWRPAVAFYESWRHAVRLHTFSNMKTVANAYMGALSLWPRLASEVATYPDYALIEPTLRKDSANEEQLLYACESLRSLVFRVLRQYL
jgi:GR25 family glycosyltransferase involved in LPS biosynthesis